MGTKTTSTTATKQNTRGDIFQFIEHNPFVRGFGHDRFLFLQIAAMILLLALSHVAGFYELIGERRMTVYERMIPIGMAFIVTVQVIYFIVKGEKPKGTIKDKAKKYTKSLFLPDNLKSWIFILLNLLMLTLAIVIATSKGFTYWEIINEFFVGSWEQLIFAVTSMTFIVQFFRTGILSEFLSRKWVSFLIPLFVIDGLFAFFHWWVYGGEIATILALAVTGLLFMGVGYLVPSLGIFGHMLYNIIVTVTII